MRIVSGSHKGIRIIAPKNLPVRPTTDMAKEALFNIINNNYYFDEIKVLDLFSGIGSISLEFASRGAKAITSVDKYKGCTSFLNTTANKLKLDIQVITSDVYRFLEKQNKQYTVIFADPPYAFEQNQFEEIYKLVFNNNLLEANGMLIIEHSKQTNLSKLPNFVKERKYGGNCFSFFENNHNS